MASAVPRISPEHAKIIGDYINAPLMLFIAAKNGRDRGKAIALYKKKTVRMARLIRKTREPHLMAVVVNTGLLMLMDSPMHEEFEEMYNAIMGAAGGHHIIAHCVNDGIVDTRVDFLVGGKSTLDAMEFVACLLAGSCEARGGEPYYLESGVANTFTRDGTKCTIKVFAIVKIMAEGTAMETRLYVCLLTLLDGYERALGERIYEHIPGEMIDEAMVGAMTAFNDAMEAVEDIRGATDIANHLVHRAIRCIIPTRFIEAFDACEEEKYKFEF